MRSINFWLQLATLFSPCACALQIKAVEEVKNHRVMEDMALEGDAITRLNQQDRNGRFSINVLLYLIHSALRAGGKNLNLIIVRQQPAIAVCFMCVHTRHDYTWLEVALSA